MLTCPGRWAAPRNQPGLYTTSNKEVVSCSRGRQVERMVDGQRLDHAARTYQRINGVYKHSFSQPSLIYSLLLKNNADTLATKTS